MNAHFKTASPITCDQTCWLFDGHTIDPFVTNSKAEAEKHAEDLNSDKQVYAVIRFNSVQREVEDVTEDFLRYPDSEPDEYPEPTPGFHTRMMQRNGAFGR